MGTRSRNISQHHGRSSTTATTTGVPRRKPGPATDLERVREAATLVFEGVPTRQVLRVLRVDRTTLWRWRRLPEWAATTAALARQVRDELLPLAHQVIAQALRAELGHGGRRPN